MNRGIAVVIPIIAGDDWVEPRPALVVRDSKKSTALAALRDAGYRVLYKGGEHSCHTARAVDYRDVINLHRHGLSEDDEITEWVITVHP